MQVMTALGILGGALRLAGKGVLGASKMGGKTMISPGIIGSMARWTVAGMVLESIPNPGARRQAIDKALYEADKEAQRALHID